MHLIHHLDEINSTLRVCLVEWILGRLEKREREREKMRKENFLEGVWLGGEEGKMIVGPWCFLPEPIKKFSPQNGEKTGWGKFDY